MKTKPDLFFSNYPFVIREVCSFGYFLYTTSLLVLVGLLWLMMTFILPACALYVLASWILAH